MAYFKNKINASSKKGASFIELSKPGEISASSFSFHATWIALAVILAVFIIAAASVSQMYRMAERRAISQSAELFAETVDARLSTTREAVSRFSYNVLRRPGWENSQRAPALARRLMDLKPEIVELSILNRDGLSLMSFASGNAFEALSLPPGLTLSNPSTLDTLAAARKIDTALFSSPYFSEDGKTPCIDLVVPDSASSDTLIARISLPMLMRQIMPASLAKSAFLSLQVKGKSIFTSAPEPQGITDAFELRLSPLPSEVTLSVAPYSKPLLFTRDASTLAILGLGAALLVAFFGLIAFQLRQRRTARRLITESAIRSAMSESIASGLRVSDMEGRAFYVNRAYATLMGKSASEIIGTKACPAGWTSQGSSISSIRHFETRITRGNGSAFDASVTITPLIDENGNQLGWLEMVSDITESKRIADELARSRDRITKVLDSIDSAVSVLGYRQGQPRLLYANPTYNHAWGESTAPHQAIFRSLSPLQEQDGSCSGTIFYHPAGRWLEARGRELVWTDGDVAQLLIATDVTQRKKNEELVAQQNKKAELSSRLMTMGEMASSLAHELNQPLGAITNYASAALTLVQMNKLSEENCSEALGKISRQAERAAAIIKRIRSFAKRTAPEMIPVSVSRLVEETLELALIQAKKRHSTVLKDIEPGLPEVVCDPVMIEQVLLNLMKNSMEASESCNDRTVRLRISRIAGGRILFEVSDHGPGISPEAREKLFEPFFSTKTEGMGIGLNICRSIIEMHGGTLRAEDNPGGGACFCFSLSCAGRHPGSA